jgi:hypothetical protein
VVALVAGNAEHALLEDRVLGVPERDGEAEVLVVVGDAREAVLAPAIGARTGVLVREMGPCIAVTRVVLTDRRLTDGKKKYDQYVDRDGGDRGDVPTDAH